LSYDTATICAAAPPAKPRDLHVMRPLGVEWARSGDGGASVLTIELTNGEEDWMIGMTGSDAAILCARIAEALRNSPGNVT
jgi:hypothetical protein